MKRTVEKERGGQEAQDLALDVYDWASYKVENAAEIEEAHWTPVAIHGGCGLYKMYRAKCQQSGDQHSGQARVSGIAQASAIPFRHGTP